MNWKNKKALAFGLMTLLWTWLMFVLSAQPAVESAQISGGLTQWLLHTLALPQDVYAALEHILRKLAHFALFAAEGFLLHSALYFGLKNAKRAVWISGGSCVVLAALNEGVQLFYEGRSCELRDIAIDSCGAFLGIAIACLCYYLIKSRRHA